MKGSRTRKLRKTKWKVSKERTSATPYCIVGERKARFAIGRREDNKEKVHIQEKLSLKKKCFIRGLRRVERGRNKDFKRIEKKENSAVKMKKSQNSRKP